MSVSSHLAISLDEYDARIRTFIPDYEEMLDIAAWVVGLRRPRAVVDLGTGTGALAARLLRVVPRVRITAIDEDGGMLGVAARRLRGRRVALVHGSFLEADVPPCDAITASFALHHIERPRAKGALFRRAHAALRRGGVLVSADCYLPDAKWLAQAGRGAWLAHLAASYGRTQGETFLQTWAKEDFYTTIAAEQRLLQSAGFTTDVVWRRDLFAVIVAAKRPR